MINWRAQAFGFEPDVLAYKVLVDGAAKRAFLAVIDQAEGDLCVYVCIYIYIYVIHIHIYICIYIERERNRERER